MLADYQMVVDMFVSIFSVGVPIGFAMLIGEKLLIIFQDFVLGKKVKL